MIFENELLKMKILIYFHQNEASVCTVGKIAERLGYLKQKISKMIIHLEEEGLVNRSDNRHPYLTKKGTLLADKYTSKMKMTADLLIHEGVSLEHVEQDAYNIVMGVSQSTMDSIKRKHKEIELKKELRGKGNFNGNVVAEFLYDGMYPVNFVMFNQNFQEDDYLSVANNYFEHPAYIFVEKGVGRVQLRLKDIESRVANNDQLIEFFYENKYLKAEVLGRFFTFPLEAFEFVTLGNDSNVQVQGNLFMKISDSKVIFNIVI